MYRVYPEDVIDLLKISLSELALHKARVSLQNHEKKVLFYNVLLHTNIKQLYGEVHLLIFKVEKYE